MRNLYIFITYTINNIGGSQLYIRKKMEYLQNKQWDVQIFFYQNGHLQINEFKENQNNIIPELTFFIDYYSTQKINTIINKIIQKLKNNYSKIIIESHSLHLATWAEFLAYKLNAKHFIYLIDEKPIMHNSYLDFMTFKYNRGELAGIIKDSINYFFRKTKLKLEKGSPFLKAHGANDCILDVEYELPKDFFEYKIGIVGRLEKEFVRNSVNALFEFANKNKQSKILIMYIGGEQNSNIIKQDIKSAFNNCTNVCLEFTGFLFPIPLKLIRYFDFCISGAGAAWAITRSNIPTLVIDPRDNLCNGILGVTTYNAIFSDEEKKTLSYWLNIISNQREKYIPNYSNTKRNIDFDIHLDTVYQSCKTNDYYISFLHNKTIKNFIMKLITQFCTIKTIMNIIRIKRYIRKIISY